MTPTDCCLSCKGTGVYHTMWDGRKLQCFKCRGTGTTPTKEINVNREQEASVKQRVREMRQEAYNQGLRDGHSEAMEAVSELLTNLAANTLDNERYDPVHREMIGKLLAGMAIEIEEARKATVKRFAP